MIAINKKLTTAIVSSTGKVAEILGLYTQSELRASESDCSDLHQPVLDSSTVAETDLIPPYDDPLY